MSVKLISLAFEADTLGATQRFVLVALADHADAAGRCYPSIARLSRCTGLSERTVQNSIKQLRAAGYIDVQMNAGKRGTNVYVLHFASAGDASPQQLHPAGDAHHPRSGCPLPPAAVAPEPSVNHQEPSEDTPLSPFQADCEQACMFGCPLRCKDFLTF